MISINNRTILSSPEAEYVKQTSQKHRKSKGQFFTPLPIAEVMSEWLLGDKTIKRILEPAFGLGIFSRILTKRNNNIEIYGYEKDNIMFQFALREFLNQPEIHLYNKDYIENDWHNSYDGIICNPPYFKFHNYDNINISKSISRKLNIRLNGFVNLYTLFLLKSIHQLNENGRASFILPSEFLNSDYGKDIKDYLVESKTLRHIFIIDFNQNVFGDAITTACILLMAKDKFDKEVHFTNIFKLEDLSVIKEYIERYPAGGEFSYERNSLNHKIKWRNYYQKKNCDSYKYLVPFTKYAQAVRGIATGSNDYFTFYKSKAAAFQIPEENLIPCICKSADIKEHFFTNHHFQRLKESDHKVYLFNAAGSKNENVLKYIKLGEKKGINEKYLTKNRKPWFAIEKRPPAPILVSVFNRKGMKFIRNAAGVHNLTTFHCIYLHNDDLFENRNIDLFFAYLLTDIAKKLFNENRREYGNGLTKFEPNDINNSKMLDLSKIDKQNTEYILNFLIKLRETNDLNYLKDLNQIFQSIYLT